MTIIFNLFASSVNINLIQLSSKKIIHTNYINSVLNFIDKHTDHTFNITIHIVHFLRALE